MDLKNPKTQRLFAAGLVAFLAAYIWHSKIYQGYEARITARAQQYEQIRTELKNVEMKFRSLNSLKEEYRDLTLRYRIVERLLPEAQNVPDLLSQIHSAALETNSLVTEVKPQGVSGEGFYNRDGYNVVMNTTYHDFGQFLAHVANFPFIANVSDLELSEVLEDRPEAEKKRGDHTMTAKFKLTAYFVQEAERLVLFDI